MITLYAAVGSCSLCTHIALIEAGLEHQVIHVALRSPTSPLPAVNPLGKVPTIVLQDGETITQNMVVLPFVADLAPATGLLPQDDPVARRRVLQWLAFFNSDVHPALKMLAGPERYSSDPDIVRANYQLIIADFFRIVEKMLADWPWLTGEVMTIADIYGSAAYHWARSFDMPLDEFPRYKAMSDRFETRASTRTARAAEVAFTASRMTRHAFMSEDWLAMAREELGTAVNIDTSVQKLNLSVIERYSDLPAQAPRPAMRIPAFRLSLAEGAIDVRYGVDPGESADLEIECTWTDAWHGVCLKNGPDLDAFKASRLASGSMKVRGAITGADRLLRNVHDRIADRTIPSASA